MEAKTRDAPFKTRNAEDCWQLLEATRGKEEFFPVVFKRSTVLQIPLFQISMLQKCESIFVILNHPVWGNLLQQT